jgi:hypothetical protein
MIVEWWNSVPLLHLGRWVSVLIALPANAVVALLCVYGVMVVVAQGYAIREIAPRRPSGGRMRTLFITLAGSFLVVACSHSTFMAPEIARTDLTCASSTTLELLVTCIRAQMPQSGSNGYVAPTPTQRAAWRTIVNQMLRGSCDFAVPASLKGIVQVKTFTDTDNGRSYCLLMEVRDKNGNQFVDHGFGTFIVYNSATRQLSHQAVHPIADRMTERQAVTVFKATASHSYLMAGAHRDANSAASTCLASAPESDASHNSNTMVQATNEELLAHYGAASWFAIQWHGMAAPTCPNTDVYLSHGRDVTPAPTDKIAVLRNNLLMQHPSWKVDLPGSSACNLNATENVQGRLLNGVAVGCVCCTAASSYTQKFIHIEQDPNFRDPRDWIVPVTATFP